MELTAELEEDEEVAALAIHSRLLQLQYAWRVGMEPRGSRRGSPPRPRRSRRGADDLHSLALLKVATAVRPGPRPPRAEAGSRPSARRSSSPTAPATGTCGWRCAGAGAYAYLCAADFDGFERILDEMLEMVGDDGSVGADIVLGSPIAWGLMGKGMVRRERLEFEEAEELFERALEVAAGGGRPGDGELDPQQPGEPGDPPRTRRRRWRSPAATSS